MFDTPTMKYRPTRSYDGEGTEESLGTGTVLWLDVVTHKSVVSAVFHRDEDVRIGDLVVIADE